MINHCKKLDFNLFQTYLNSGSHLGLLSHSILTLVMLCLSLMVCSVSMVQGQEQNFETFLETLRKEALDSGISKETLDAALKGLQPIPEIIERDRNQPEAKLTLNEYLTRITTEERITKGRMKLSENRTLLARISERYGVQPRFLMALWGIETDFGKSTGNYPVIGSLVTLIYDGRRSALFKKEFINALRILDEGHIPLEQMKGSWAGAMGQLQFMPSTFRQFAVDFDADGKIDIWKSLADALASAANYLAQAGWQPHNRWGCEVRLPDSFDLSSLGLTHRKRVSEWQGLGVRTLDGSEFPRQNLLSSVIQPDGQTGRTFMVYSNYEIILKWNRSHNFAITVGTLSDRIGRF
jgi:membrane-bound lytic murein transglycosylase B